MFLQPEPLSPPRKPKVRNDVSDLRSRTPIPQLAVVPPLHFSHQKEIDNHVYSNSTCVEQTWNVESS